MRGEQGSAEKLKVMARMEQIGTGWPEVAAA